MQDKFNVILSFIHNRKSILPTNTLIDHVEKYLTDTSQKYAVILNTTDVNVMKQCVELARQGKVDKFILVNSPTGFANNDIRYTCGMLFWLAKKTIFIQNDYVLKPPSQCKSVPLKEFLDYRDESQYYYGFKYIITTLRDVHTYGHNTMMHVDWNALWYKPVQNPKPYSQRIDGIFYYGSFRKDRIEKFRKYFDTIEYSVILSYPKNSTLAKREYSAMCPSAEVVDVGNAYELLQNYKASIILCDKKSSSQYHCIPTRFWECLSAHTAMFFDADMEFTLQNAQIKDYEKYIVHNDAELAAALQQDLEKVAEEQFAMWHTINKAEAEYNKFVQHMEKIEND